MTINPVTSLMASSMTFDSVATKNPQITFEDVRSAVGESDPNSTNASKIRAQLGRGSFATIQKHIETLRELLRDSVNPVESTSIPAPSNDVVNALWGTAYNYASNMFHTNQARLSLQRDNLMEQLEMMRVDFESVLERVDKAEQELADACAVRDSSVAVLVDAQSDLKALQVAFDQFREKSALEASQAALAAANEVQLLQRDRTIERQSMQATVDVLTGQVGELKSLLAMQNRAAPAVPARPVRPGSAPTPPLH
jgi:hypothetical protein